jgi:hypothetical protein
MVKIDENSQSIIQNFNERNQKDYVLCIKGDTLKAEKRTLGNWFKRLFSNDYKLQTVTSAVTTMLNNESNAQSYQTLVSYLSDKCSHKKGLEYTGQALTQALELKVQKAAQQIQPPRKPSIQEPSYELQQLRDQSQKEKTELQTETHKQKETIQQLQKELKIQEEIQRTEGSAKLVLEVEIARLKEKGDKQEAIIKQLQQQLEQMRAQQSKPKEAHPQPNAELQARNNQLEQEVGKLQQELQQLRNENEGLKQQASTAAAIPQAPDMGASAAPEAPPMDGAPAAPPFDAPPMDGAPEAPPFDAPTMEAPTMSAASSIDINDLRNGIKHEAEIVLKENPSTKITDDLCKQLTKKAVQKLVPSAQDEDIKAWFENKDKQGYRAVKKYGISQNYSALGVKRMLDESGQTQKSKPKAAAPAANMMEELQNRLRKRGQKG